MPSANYIVHDNLGNIVATGIVDRNDRTQVAKYNARCHEAFEKGHFVTMGTGDMRRVKIAGESSKENALDGGPQSLPPVLHPPRSIAAATFLGTDADAAHEESLEALATMDAERRQKALKRERDKRYREKKRKEREPEVV